MVKNSPAGESRATSSIPGFERSPGVGNGNPLQYFTWNILWTEKPSRLHSIGPQGVGQD